MNKDKAFDKIVSLFKMSLAKKKYKKKLKNHYYHEGYKSLNYDNVYKSLYNSPVHIIPRPKINETVKK